MAKFRVNVKKRARILTRAEFKRMLKVASITREATRNQAILCLSFACGLRVTELASITIRDIMHPSGKLKSELTLRADITKNAHVRTVPMSSKTLIDHLDLYLQYRIENRIGVLPVASEDFRGLSPDLPVVFSNRGGPFALARKKRVLETCEEEEYKACDALEQLFRTLYKTGGYRGASSHSGRRSFATSLIQQGVEIEDVSRLLGHSDLDFTRPYLETSKGNVQAAFESALGEEVGGEGALSAEELALIQRLLPRKNGDNKTGSRKAKNQPEVMEFLAKNSSYADIDEIEALPLPSASNLLDPVIPHENSVAELLKRTGKRNTASWITDSLPHFSLYPVSGVYFLISSENEIVYVGQSTNLISRIPAHYRDKKKFPHFSKVAVLQVPAEQLNEVEENLIQLLKPRLNGTIQ